MIQTKIIGQLFVKYCDTSTIKSISEYPLKIKHSIIESPSPYFPDYSQTFHF